MKQLRGYALRRGLRQPGEPGCEAGGDVVAKDCDRPSQCARRAVEARHDGAGETVGTELGDARRVICSRLHALRLQRLSDLRDQERVPAGHGMARRGEGVARLAVELPRQVARRAVEAEGTRSCHVDGGVCEEAGEQILGGVRPRGHEDRGRHAGEAQREKAQQRDGLVVGPLCVVDGKQQRLRLSELGEQPVQPMVRARQRGAPARQRCARAPGAPAEREAALQLAPACRQHSHARRTRTRHCRLYERRLADARLALERQYATPAVARFVEQDVDERDLRVALDQFDAAHRHRRDHRPGGHGMPIQGRSQGRPRRSAARRPRPSAA